MSNRSDDYLQHVIPEGDLREHEPRLDCWCRPEVEDGIAVHRSMDGREAYERGTRRPS